MFLLDDVAGESVPDSSIQGEKESPHVKHRVALERPRPHRDFAFPQGEVKVLLGVLHSFGDSLARHCTVSPVVLIIPTVVPLVQ